MKKKLVLLAFLAGGLTAIGQKTASLHTSQSPNLKSKAHLSLGNDLEKTLVCARIPFVIRRQKNKF